MKNCLLISYFNSQNYGDLFISEKFFSILSEYCTVHRYHISGNANSGNSQSTRNYRVLRLLKKMKRGFAYSVYKRISIRKRVYRELSNCNIDIAVFGGGNLLFETSETSQYLTNLEEICRYLRKKGIKYVFSSIGAGPFYSQSQFDRARKLVSFSEYTSFRDKESYLLMNEDKESTNTFITVDPVLSCSLKIKGHEEKDYVLFNIIDLDLYSNSFDKEAVEKELVIFIEKTKSYFNKEIILFSSDKADYEELWRIQRLLEEKDISVSVKEINSADELLILISDACYVFASRMHSLIISFLLKKDFFAFSWVDKVYSFMTRIHMDNKVMRYDDISFDKAIEMIAIKEDDTNSTLCELKQSYDEELRRLKLFIQWNRDDYET